MSLGGWIFDRYATREASMVTLLGKKTPVLSPFGASLGDSDGKESVCNAGHLGSITELGRSPGGGHGNPLQYSCLENPHGQRSLAGPCGRKESNTIERLSTHSHFIEENAQVLEPHHRDDDAHSMDIKAGNWTRPPRPPVVPTTPGMPRAPTLPYASLEQEG